MQGVRWGSIHGRCNVGGAGKGQGGAREYKVCGARRHNGYSVWSTGDGGSTGYSMHRYAERTGMCERHRQCKKLRIPFWAYKLYRVHRRRRASRVRLRCRKCRMQSLRWIRGAAGGERGMGWAGFTGGLGYAKRVGNI